MGPGYNFIALNGNSWALKGHCDVGVVQEGIIHCYLR